VTQGPLLHEAHGSRPHAGWVATTRARPWLGLSVRCCRVDYFDAVVLGVVEGLTEFLPVSSTGHLTIASKLLGLDIDDPAVTGYTAVIQMGAIAAVIVYFARDIWNIIRAWTLGLVRSEYRGQLDHRMGWYVIVATIPVGVAGFLGQDLITGALRSLWVVAVALIAWSLVLYVAERVGRQDRPERDLNMTDAVAIGVAQAVALIPGISRSGATISAGLFRGLDRVTATKLSFFMSIPALLAAGVYELKDAFSGDIGVGEAVVGVVVAFLVAYASIAWLLRFVAHHTVAWFVPYRVALGVLLLVLLGAGVLSPT
jgi:undecaprenyl-diphosphatase